LPAPTVKAAVGVDNSLGAGESDSAVSEEFFQFDDNGNGLRAVAAAVSNNTQPWNTTLLTWLNIAGVVQPVNASTTNTTTWNTVPAIVRVPTSGSFVQPVPFAPTDFDSTDRRSLTALRKPRAIPEADITRMNHNVTMVRSLEQQHNALCDSINQLNGYVPPCSLYYRPDMCGKLVKSQQANSFTVDFYGQGTLQINYDHSTQQDPYAVVSNVRVMAQHAVPELVKDPSVFSSTLTAILGPDASATASATSYSTRPDDHHFIKGTNSGSALHRPITSLSVCVSAIAMAIIYVCT